MGSSAVLRGLTFLVVPSSTHLHVILSSVAFETLTSRKELLQHRTLFEHQPALGYAAEDTVQ